MRTTLLPRILCWIFLGLSIGCGGPKALLPVSGKVTYRGQPVPGGTIAFTPDAKHGEHGPMAVGEIAPDGTYSLRTGKDFGAAAGVYRVTVAAVTSRGIAPPGQPFHVPQSLVPEKYRDPELSQVTSRIEPDRANIIDIDLK
jgi:hypothetical protein